MTPEHAECDRKTLDRDRYIPAYLLRLSNGMSRSASRVYRALFGVGIIEWRILSILSIESFVTAQRICDAIDLDRGAASRTLEVMSRKGLVHIAADVTDNRKRPITITRSGKTVHDQLLTIATKRQRLLLRNFSADELGELRTLLRQMTANLDAVYRHDRALARDAPRPKRK